MTSMDDDDFDDEEEIRGGLTRKLRTVGALKAYNTAMAICDDPKATAAAKASAVNSLFRAGGFFASTDDDGGQKEPHEMTAEEIGKRIALLRRGGKLGSRIFD